MSGMITLSFKVSDRVQHTLYEHGKQHGYTPSNYAKLLFEAGFGARIGQLRGEKPHDMDLDEQVRAVFALCGEFSTAAISRAIKIPEARVVRILDGWRMIAADLKLPKDAKQAVADEPVNLSDAQTIVFIELYEAVTKGETFTHAELAKRAEVPAGAVSNAMHQFAMNHLIVTHRARGTRASTYELTEKGKKLAREMTDD